MRLSGVGGGFFYGPFQRTITLGPYTPATPGGGVPGYGAWTHEPTAKIVNIRGRWLTFQAWPATPLFNTSYSLQLALGAAGSEAVWQPSDASGFYLNWDTLSTEPGIIPFSLSFPISTQNNSEISVRISLPGATVSPHSMQVFIYIWG